MDEYVKFGKTVLIVECLPTDEDPKYGRVFYRKVRILSVLLGEAKKEQIIHVLVGQSLTPSCLYMIYSGQVVEEGELQATSYEPAVFPISLWSEVSKAEKEKCLADFLKELEPLSLTDKLLLVIEQSVSNLKEEQKELDSERKDLEKLLPKSRR